MKQAAKPSSVASSTTSPAVACRGPSSPGAKPAGRASPFLAAPRGDGCNRPVASIFVRAGLAQAGLGQAGLAQARLAQVGFAPAVLPQAYLRAACNAVRRGLCAVFGAAACPWCPGSGPRPGCPGSEPRHLWVAQRVPVPPPIPGARPSFDARSFAFRFFRSCSDSSITTT